MAFRGADRWQLSVENVNDGKYIDSFNWIPPAGLAISAVTSVSRGGTCRLYDGGLRCSGSIPPEPCLTCDSETLTINFTGNGTFNRTLVHSPKGNYWANSGWSAGDLTVTSISSQPFEDEPACAKGQASTKSRPCIAK